MITAKEALNRLREGNRRYVSESAVSDVVLDQSQRTALVEGQHPFAIILGCSDSRAPAELIFDQGLGDLFVIRVAGNIVKPSQVGSVEFAAVEFGTPLVVVMGHTHCGAVKATLEQLRNPQELPSPNLESIVGCIRPALVSLEQSSLPNGELLQQAVRANVQASVSQLKDGSDIIKNLVKEEKLTVVGAVYSLETGEVDFFEGLPETSE